MKALDELAAVIYKARWVDGIKDASHISDAALAETIHAAGWRKPRTITTTDEVDALPNLSIVATSQGDAETIHRDNHDDAYHFLVLYGPATVLHEPEATK